MKVIVLCFFIIASFAVNLVELYEYDSNINNQAPNAMVGAPPLLYYRPGGSLAGKIITRRDVPVKTSATENAQLEMQRNKRHIPGFSSPILSTHFYHPAAPIAAYPVAAPVVPVVEEAPYLPTYHYAPYGPYASPYGGPFGGPFGAHAVL